MFDPPFLLVLSSPREILLAAAALGYVLGSIPFGLLLTRIFGLGDLRSIGSGNIGATNVLRTGNKAVAALTLLFDVAKGAAAVLIATYLWSPAAGIVAGSAAFLGHLFPVWLGFRGGKGVATYLGVLIGAAWPAAAVFGLTWLAVAATTRLSSLAALAATAISPIAAYVFGGDDFALAATLMSTLIVIRHRANIRRLRAGKEPKIGAKA